MKAPYFSGSLASRFGSLFHYFSHCFGVVLLLFLMCFLLTVSGHCFGVLVDCFGVFKGFKCRFFCDILRLKSAVFLCSFLVF